MQRTQVSHYQVLKRQWGKRLKTIHKRVYEKHGESIAWLNNSTQKLLVGSTGLFLLTQPITTSAIAQNLQPQNASATVHETPQRTATNLVSILNSILPNAIDPLSIDQEDTIIRTLSNYFNLRLFSTIENKRLNRSYGLIGAEQHLTRYPGDTMNTHFFHSEEQQIIASGMAPGRGAWGYFANSQNELTDTDIQREKWYMAVPTFLSPGWEANSLDLYTFFKYRKMLVVNPQNGKAVIADIADAGPAQWTGKHLGGSPEVMSYLERHDGSVTGPVLYFFIDDPADTISLGPIQVQ